MFLLLSFELHPATPINLRELQQEFVRVGIYKPQSPELYDERRAAEILALLATNPAYTQLAQTMRRQELESLRQRAPSSMQAELLRLRQENEQLRNRRPVQTNEPVDCQAQLSACRERLDLFFQLASRTISRLNDFERVIIAAAHELEGSTGWGFATSQNRARRLVNAERFIDEARAQVQGLSSLRIDFERLFLAS